MGRGVPLDAVVPIGLLLAAFVIYCLYDIARQPSTRGLAKPWWVLLTLISIPLGGLIYLLLGRTSLAGDKGDHD